MDSFDKAGLYYNYSGYENKVKRISCNVLETQYVRKHLARRDSTQTAVQVEKNGKTKEIEENRFPGYVLVNGHDR